MGYLWLGVDSLLSLRKMRSVLVFIGGENWVWALARSHVRARLLQSGGLAPRNLK
jgi:hypothetical protein